MNATASPLQFADALHACYSPRDPYEQFLVEQLIWAAMQLRSLIAEAPATPDARWLRLYNTADRSFHRNARLLDKARKAALAAQAAPAEAAPAVAPAAAPWPPEPAPSTGGLTRVMRYMLSEAEAPDALLAEWVADGLLPQLPTELEEAARQRDEPPQAAGPPRAVA